MMSARAWGKNTGMIIGRLLLAILMLLVCSSALSAPNKHELTQQQLKQLKQQISRVQKSLSKINRDKNKLVGKLKSVELKINKLSKDIFVLEEKIVSLEKQHADLKRRQKALKHKLEEQKKLLAGQAKASYNMGKQEYLKLLLNQQNPEVISRVMTYYRFLNQARSQQIDIFSQTIDEVNENRKQIQLKQQEIALQHHLYKEEKISLQRTEKDHTQVIDKLSKQQKSEAQKLKQLQDNEKQLNRLLTQLQKALENVPVKLPKKPFAKSKGKLKWPTRGKLRRLFGHWRSVNKVKWQGVIINNREGSPVYSLSHGRVAYSDWLRGYGLLTIIDHGNGYMSLYGNNQTLLKEVGDWVESGEIIAKTGRSGGRRKAGLYFEIRRKGRPVNPTRWCKKMPKK